MSTEKLETKNPPLIKKLSEDQKKKVCGQCQGWCCYRFSIVLPKLTNKKPNWEESGWDKEDVEFMSSNFKVVPQCPNLGHRVSQSPKGEHKYTFTCLKYDIDKGVCRGYNNRPELCRLYFCGSSSPPQPSGPHKNQAVIQARCMKYRGINWKNLLDRREGNG